MQKDIVKQIIEEELVLMIEKLTNGLDNLVMCTFLFL